MFPSENIRNALGSNSLKRRNLSKISLFNLLLENIDNKSIEEKLKDTCLDNCLCTATRRRKTSIISFEFGALMIGLAVVSACLWC